MIRGVCGSIKSVIGECVVDKGCGSDWIVRNMSWRCLVLFVERVLVDGMC